MEVCSPVARNEFKKNKTCFSKTALIRIAELWNNNNKNNAIKGLYTKSKHNLWRDINDRMQQQCNGSGREWCWADKLGANNTTEVAKSLRPKKPSEWYKKPYAWLSNYDIQAVMTQYQEDPANKYVFLGVFPIDFTSKDAMGQCICQEICTLDITKFIKKGIKYIGFITNLDRHDESGSHWTSTFICIDPHMPCYGAYYYDSVSRETPPSVKGFMKSIHAQLPYKDVKSKFKLEYSEQREQSGNTECGMFSILYQLRWLETLQKNPNSTFGDVLKVKMNDAFVHKYRDILFRPNTKEVVKTT
jgi:hypothetical protein